jgi:hypothetical protein
MGGGGFGRGGAGFGGLGGTGISDVGTWVTSNCKSVNYGGSATLYDCAGAAG